MDQPKSDAKSKKDRDIQHETNAGSEAKKLKGKLRPKPAKPKINHTCPNSIIEHIFSKRACKLNLDQRAAKRLSQPDAADYCTRVRSNFDKISKIPTSSISLLPHGYEDKVVNVSPYAITHLNCINEKPPKRVRRRKKGGKKKPQETKDANQKQSAPKQNGSVERDLTKAQNTKKENQESLPEQVLDCPMKDSSPPSEHVTDCPMEDSSSLTGQILECSTKDSSSPRKRARKRRKGGKKKIEEPKDASRTQSAPDQNGSVRRALEKVKNQKKGKQETLQEKMLEDSS